jgi:ACS family hexuronate transporter-like MFS transporter
VAAPALVAEFGIDNTEFGTITAAFLFCYGIGHLIAGPFIDRVGTRAAFKLAVIAWSIAGFLHAFGRGFFSFIACRALLGLTEAANFPAAVKAIAEWFPRRDRSMAVGILTVGPGLGALLAPPLLGGLIIVAGWRAAFIVPALAGFVWLWFWLRFYRSPARHPDITDAERALILADDPQQSSVTEPSSAWADGRQTACCGTARSGACCSAGSATMGLSIFSSASCRCISRRCRASIIREIAAFAWVPFLAADVGALFGGWVGRQLMLRGWSLDAARKSVIWGGAVLVVLTLPAATSESPAVDPRTHRAGHVCHPGQGLQPVRLAGRPVSIAAGRYRVGAVWCGRQLRCGVVQLRGRLGFTALRLCARVRGRRGHAVAVGGFCQLVDTAGPCQVASGTIVSLAMRTELVTTLKRQATELLSDIERDREPILITQHGLPSAYLVDVESYESMQQRMALLEGIARGEMAVAEGRVLTNAQAKARMARWLR